MAVIEETKIRNLAYQLWENEERPDGRDEDFWHAAEKLLADEGEVVAEDGPVSGLAIPAVVASKVA